ncbi:MAG: acyl-CoA dehydrogenase [Gammaproteobacteria bacterium]
MIELLIFFILAWMLAYRNVRLHLATEMIAVYLAVLSYFDGINVFMQISWALFLLLLLPFNIPALRRALLSRRIFKAMHSALPPMSETEREALEAGTVWWDAELFSGRPNWKILQDLPPARLSAAEQAFLHGPVEELCAMLNDWDITHKRRDLPPQVWTFIKQQKFFGMIIPKQYGGLDFSNYAHSEVVMKIASRCVSAAVTVMVPNSLGPAKLLLEYGTETQKNHYLPRLARGEEIPCFALTGPLAGSDASAIPDTGIVCYGNFAGRDEVLGIRLNWEKRYITLGPVATVLGLAFKLYDPDHLLGEQEDIGITVALIPTDTPGISIGMRHFPLDSAFQNGPNWGKDVFIPLDWIIGGPEQAGKGWKMLMQCLATGRGISLPALSTGGAKFTSRNTGAYARIREQFNRPIGTFEGIEEALARIAGETYILDAARKITTAALDNGHKPAVLSAVAKYESTERLRRIVNDGMDIQGGSGICLGPRNYLGRLYQVIPVSITVEGANILTRSMIIFGQGAMRCHPYLQREMQAMRTDDTKLAIRQFDTLLCKHIGFVLRNAATCFWLGLSAARFIKVPGNRQSKRYYRQIARLSAGFALLTDFALITVGGHLKRKESLSGCFADVLSNLYLCCCVLKQYHDQNNREEDSLFLHWTCRHTIYCAQQALRSILHKLPLQLVVQLLRWIIFPYGKSYFPPNDRLRHEIATVLLNDSPARERLTHGIYVNRDENDATGRIELAFAAVQAAAPVEFKLRSAQKKRRLSGGVLSELIASALNQGILSPEEAAILRAAESARMAAIAVDAFTAEELTLTEHLMKIKLER